MNHCILQASFFFLMEARTDLRLRVSQELLTKVLQKVVTREGQCGTWWDWALRNRSQSHKILPQMSHSLFCGMLESKHSLFNQKLSLQNQVVWFRDSGIPHIVTVFRFLWKREFPQVSDLTWHPDFTWGRDFRLRILAKLGPNPVSDSSREFCFTRLSSSRNTLEIVR